MFADKKVIYKYFPIFVGVVFSQIVKFLILKIWGILKFQRHTFWNFIKKFDLLVKKDYILQLLKLFLRKIYVWIQQKSMNKIMFADKKVIYKYFPIFVGVVFSQIAKFLLLKIWGMLKFQRHTFWNFIKKFDLLVKKGLYIAIIEAFCTKIFV